MNLNDIYTDAKFITTNVGDVVFSPKVMRHLNRVAPRVVADMATGRKPRRGKKYQEEMRQMQRVMVAATVCAEIEYRAGGLLETF